MSLDLLPVAVRTAPVPEPAARRTMLDVTIARLDVDRIVEMGALAAPESERADARIAVIGRISRLDPDGWLATRWYRWARMFGLPGLPASPTPAARLLLAPYDAVGHVHRKLAPYVSGVLAVFDAGLALAPGVPDGPESTEVLLRGWTEACLPTTLTPGTAYGPRTPEVEEVLRHAWAASPAARLRAHRARAAIPAHTWNTACGAVDDASTVCGVPFLARYLFGEALAVTADSGLADAVWGAAVAAAFHDDLPEPTRDLLASPFRAAA
ncbi:MAG: hypothetical protein QOH17_4820 [Pseudonocardiales bacterium]|nr:hypothetical protein [Pseudonocardiales bacterium]